MSTGYIRPELASLAVPISTLTRYPGNPRRGDQHRIRTSLREHGQYKPLLVQSSTRFVVAGNNTLDVMIGLGWTEAAAVMLDIDDHRARHLLLIDNRSSDTADYDEVLLADALAGVTDWDASGWSVEELDTLMAQLVATGAVDLDELTPEAPLEPAPPPQPPAAPPRLPPAPVHPSPPTTSPRPPVPVSASPAAAPPLLVEWSLLYTRDDRAEAQRLVAAARGWLGDQVTPADVVLRALRALAVVGDSRHDPHATIRIGQLMLAAGRNPLEDLL